MATENVERGGMVLGRDAGRSKRLLAVAACVFVLTFLARTPSGMFPLAVPFEFDLRILLLLAAVPSLVAAYWNDGFLVSVSLAAAPTLAFFVSLSLFDTVPPSPTLVWGFEIGFAAALVVGVPAYLVGAVTRRIVAPR